MQPDPDILSQEKLGKMRVLIISTEVSNLCLPYNNYAIHLHEQVTELTYVNYYFGWKQFLLISNLAGNTCITSLVRH